MMTAPGIIAIMAPALLAVAAALIWALHEISFLRASLRKAKWVNNLFALASAARAKRITVLRAELAEFRTSETKRQAQRVADLAAAARARAAKCKGS